MGKETEEGVDVVKFQSIGDWEVLYIDGESVKQNHQGRIDVLSYLEGLTIDSVVRSQVNLPQDDYRYPETLEEVLEDERYDITEEDL